MLFLLLNCRQTVFGGSNKINKANCICNSPCREGNRTTERFQNISGNIPLTLVSLANNLLIVCGASCNLLFF